MVLFRHVKVSKEYLLDEKSFSWLSILAKWLVLMHRHTLNILEQGVYDEKKADIR